VQEMLHKKKNSRVQESIILIANPPNIKPYSSKLQKISWKNRTSISFVTIRQSSLSRKIHSPNYALKSID
jgi:hypothetical protein